MPFDYGTGGTVSSGKGRGCLAPVICIRIINQMSIAVTMILIAGISASQRASPANNVDTVIQICGYGFSVWLVGWPAF